MNMNRRFEVPPRPVVEEQQESASEKLVAPKKPKVTTGPAWDKYHKALTAYELQEALSYAKENPKFIASEATNTLIAKIQAEKTAWRKAKLFEKLHASLTDDLDTANGVFKPRKRPQSTQLKENVEFNIAEEDRRAAHLMSIAPENPDFVASAKTNQLYNDIKAITTHVVSKRKLVNELQTSINDDIQKGITTVVSQGLAPKNPKPKGSFMTGIISIKEPAKSIEVLVEAPEVEEELQLDERFEVKDEQIQQESTELPQREENPQEVVNELAEDFSNDDTPESNQEAGLPIDVSVENDGFTLEEQPEQLEANDLIRNAKEGNLTEITSYLHNYHKIWNRYATDRNLFSLGPVNILWKAIVEAEHSTKIIFHAGNAAERAIAEQKLRTVVEVINQSLIPDLLRQVAGAEAHVKRFEEATHAEHKDTLTSAVDDIELLTNQAEVTEAQPIAESEPLEDSSVLKTQELEIEEPSRPKRNRVRGVGREKIDKAYEATNTEREVMQDAKDKYLNAIKDHYQFKGGKKSNEPEEIGLFKREYDEARIAYGNILTDSAIARLSAESVQGSEPTDYEKRLIQRYKRLVRFNEVVKPAAELRYEARLAGMGSREKGMVSKALSWVGNKNKVLEEKYGKNGARIIKVLSTTAIAGTVGVASGALATLGVAGLAGWGAARVGRSLASSFLSTGAGAAVGSGYRNTLGKFLQGRAEKKVSSIGRTSGELTIEDLEQYDEERAQYVRGADSRTLEKETAVLSALVAFGLGAELSASLQHLPSGSTGSVELAHAAGNKSDAVPTFTVHSDFNHEPLTHQDSLVSNGLKTSIPDNLVPLPHETIGTSPVEHVVKHAATHAQPSEALQKAMVDLDTHNAPAHAPIHSPFKPIKLPVGMDPNSAEATAYLNKHYGEFVAQSAPTESAPIDQTSVDVTNHESPSDVSPSETKLSSGIIETHDQQVITGERFVNSHNISIEPKEAHVYEIKGQKTQILSGGTLDDRLKKAKEFFSQPGHEKMRLITAGNQLDAKTGKPMSMSFITDKDGNVLTHLNDTKKLFLGRTKYYIVPDPKDFTKIIS